MILCLDMGNSHIYGGVFEKENLLLRFRYSSVAQSTSDQLGVFLKNVLRENFIDPANIKHISISSVVPSLDYSLSSAIKKYFKQIPFFLKAGIKTGLKIAYKNPLEIGADRIANAIAAIEHFPDQDRMIIDLGTATTIDLIQKNKTYLGGLIMPGLSIAMKALSRNTAKLPPVNIKKPSKIIGQSTIENIQAGLYYGHLGAMREIIHQINLPQPVIIGTGGFAHLFKEENIFDVILPDLVLQGLRLVLQKNINLETIEKL